MDCMWILNRVLRLYLSYAWVGCLMNRVYVDR